MNEHRKIPTLEACLKEANGVLGRVFGDRGVGLYIVRIINPNGIPLEEGANPKNMNVLYWDYTDWDPREKELQYDEHKDDRAFSAEILLELLRRAPLTRTNFLKGVFYADPSLVVGEKSSEPVKIG
jgi:hypothetical protein